MTKLEKYNILLVEDEPLLLRSLQRNIQALDSDFVVAATASNGQEALTCLQSTDIHLIITDIIMPVMSGLELLAYVNNHYPNILVAVVSGYADFVYAQEALKNHALTYILKPSTQENISEVLLSAKLKLDSKYQLLEEANLSGRTVEQSFAYIRNYLKEHYPEQIDLNALAAQLGYSPAYLTKIFSKYEKCTPIKYLTTLRINHARHLLLNTTLTIKEIGEKVGYGNQFYFSRIFRKCTCQTPSEYRESQHDSDDCPTEASETAAK